MKVSFVALLTLSCAATALAQHPPTSAPAGVFPTTVAAIRDWDADIVRRAAAMIATPAKWNRSDASTCKHAGPSFSLRCALELAADDAAAAGGAPSKATGVACSMRVANGHAEGSCGDLFDEATVFSLAPVRTIATGKWRKERAPTAIWSGRMINPGEPVMLAARTLVDSIAPGKYRNARLAEFNDDPTVTFTDLESYFHNLAARVARLGDADLAASYDDVELELYGSSPGVIRTYNGWYTVSDFAEMNGTLRFRIDTTAEVVPNALDREILQRADALLSSDAVWNRADNRKCPANAKTWSIYCALEDATREVTGGFHHRRPALETVRVLVDERTKNRGYHHRLMEYNNDTTTHLSDVRSLFAAALAKTPH